MNEVIFLSFAKTPREYFTTLMIHNCIVDFSIMDRFFTSVILCPWLTSASLLDFHRFCGTIEGRLSHFLPRWIRTGWQSVISQGKNPSKTPLQLGIAPGPWGEQTVSYPTELP